MKVATGKALSLWRQAQDLRHKIDSMIFVLDRQNKMAAMAWGFAQGMTISVTSPKSLEDELIELKNTWQPIRNAMNQVDDNVYGIQESDGDIDIVQPSNEMGAIVLAIVGIVVVAGLVATCVAMYRHSREVNKKYNRLRIATDNVFCENPDSEQCTKWIRYKKESGYDLEENLVDTAIRQVGSAVATGAKFGIGAGIAILAIALAMSMRKK